MDLYIDESGYTGADYCNKEQPLFVLACNWFDNAESLEIENRIISEFGCSEVKFSKLVSTGKGKKELEKIVERINSQSMQSKYSAYVVHKKSALVRKFVDDCIEPAMYAQGIDMLQDGRLVGYANLISTTLPVFLGAEWYEEFLLRYNQLIRLKNNASNKALFEHCKPAEKNKNALRILHPYINEPELVMEEISSPTYRSDIYEPALMGLIVHVRNMFGVSDFSISLDATKATSISQTTNFLKNLEGLTTEHRMSDVCTIHPDIKISNINMVDSKQAIGIRMSDVVAGLFSWSFKAVSNMSSLLATALQLKIADRNMIHMIYSEDVTPESLGMTDVRNPWIKKK